MRYSLSVLNVLSGLVLAGGLVYTIFNYAELSEGEGWGILVMLVLGAFGIGGLIVDLLLQVLIRNKETMNLVGTLIALAVTAFIIFS
jgi:hypothetical protein